MYRSSAFLYVRPPPSDANRTVNNVSVRRINPAVRGNDVSVHVVVRGNDISVSGAGVAENGNHGAVMDFARSILQNHVAAAMDRESLQQLNM